jgi:hypothetical protein
MLPGRLKSRLTWDNGISLDHGAATMYSGVQIPDMKGNAPKMRQESKLNFNVRGLGISAFYPDQYAVD